MARAVPRSAASAIRGRNAAAEMIAWTEPIRERLPSYLVQLTAYILPWRSPREHQVDPGTHNAFGEHPQCRPLSDQDHDVSSCEASAGGAFRARGRRRSGLRNGRRARCGVVDQSVDAPAAIHRSVDDLLRAVVGRHASPLATASPPAETISSTTAWASVGSEPPPAAPPSRWRAH